MSVKDHLKFFKFNNEQDYSLAESGLGFLIPGSSAKAAISPPEPIEYFALLTFREGEPRGNHYHKEKVEYMIILNGSLHCDFSLVSNRKDSYSVKLNAGEMVRISPGCTHTYTAVGGDATALEISPQKLDLSDVIELENK